MPEAWDLLVMPALSAPWNMAVDEMLLRTATQRQRPVLRVYQWDRPSVSFGYFQKYPARLAKDYAIIRRPTGGGIVYHGDGVDTTYTVVVPPGDPLHAMKTERAYETLHQAVACALALPGALHGAAGPQRGQYECFQNPVAGDVVADGRKLAGGAQRRGRNGMLHQGSIAAQVTVDQLQRAFQQQFNAGFAPVELTDEQNRLAEKLVREKYGTEKWNRRIG